MTDDRWQAAWDATQARILAHPDFRRLVREVAVAEAPLKSTARRFRDSYTYGLWLTRGERGLLPHGRTRRAWLLAGRIATELGVLPTLPPGEGAGRVYGAAAEYARARELPPAVR